MPTFWPVALRVETRAGRALSIFDEPNFHTDVIDSTRRDFTRSIINFNTHVYW